MKLRYYGHSCFALEMGALCVLIDPFIRPNAAAASVAMEGLHPTHILPTHGHEDHVADAEDIAKKSGAELFAIPPKWPLGSIQGCERVRPINPGATFTLSSKRSM